VRTMSLFGSLALCLGLCLAAPAAPANAAAATISRSALITYGTCPARSVVLTVTLPRKPFTPGELVQYLVSLRNRSGHTCGPSRSPAAPPGNLAELLGPCGPIKVIILNARDVAVYPGLQAYMCPDYLGPMLKGHQMVTAGGSWNQTQGGGRPARVVTLVPRGTYRLIVAGRVSVPIFLPPP
jgi:hypothetical protein